MAATAEEKATAARQKADRAEDANWDACTGCGFSRRLQLSPVGDTSVKVVVRHRIYVPYAEAELGNPPIPGHMEACSGSLQPPADVDDEPVMTWPAYYGQED
jgi:hypothetical protein